MCQEVRSLITPHKFNIDSKKWPYLKAGVTFFPRPIISDINSLVFRDVFSRVSMKPSNCS